MAWFVFLTSVTPGPNTLMLVASGMNYGYRRTLPHIFGVVLGFGTLVLLCAAGVGQIYQLYPEFRWVLKILGTVYLLYLAYRVATAEKTRRSNAANALTTRGAMAFQFVNPKAWVMSLTTVSTFMPDVGSPTVLVMAVVSIAMCINLPCLSVWALFGAAMSRGLASRKIQKVVNLTMATLLAGTIPFIVF